MATPKKQKRRPARARTEWHVRRIILTVLIAALVCGGIYEIYVLNTNPIRVEPAVEETIVDRVRASAFIFRDEQCIQTQLSAYAVPFVQDGERVSANGAIAANFSDAGSARRFAQLLELREEYDRLSALASGTQYGSVRVSALTDDAMNGLCELLEQTDTGNIADAEDVQNTFLEKETALEIAVGENINISATLNDLASAIRAQEASVGSYQTVTTGLDSSGYFFRKTDGFEDVIAYADADSLTVSQVQAALMTLPVSSTGGKIVKSFEWFIATVVDSQTAEKLSHTSGELNIAFPQAGLGKVNVTIHAMRADATGKCAVVFRCIDSTDALLRLRKADIEIELGRTTGYRVPLCAVRVITEESGETVKGVYVLRGNIISFRKINPVYSGDDYILSGVCYKPENNKEIDTSYIGMYEEIIVEGKDLRAGEVVYR